MDALKDKPMKADASKGQRSVSVELNGLKFKTVIGPPISKDAREKRVMRTAEGRRFWRTAL